MALTRAVKGGETRFGPDCAVGESATRPPVLQAPACEVVQGGAVSPFVARN